MKRNAAFGKIIAERLRDEPSMIAHGVVEIWERWMKSCAAKLCCRIWRNGGG